jgi:rod shape-determining protein MreD
VKSAFWQRLDLWARRIIPAVLSLFFVLVTVLPLPVPGYSSIVPMLALASVFFWAVHDPRLLPPVVVFAIGLVQDTLSGAPIGAGAVVLLAVYGVTTSQRRFFHNRSFIQVWVGFMVVAFAAAALNWLLTVVIYGAFAPSQAALFQYLLSIAIYPLVTWLMHGAQRFLPTEA